MEEQTLLQFRQANSRSNKRRQCKIRNSWGVYDAYKAIRKNHWYDIGRPVKEKEFYAIIRGVNKLFAESLALGDTVTFPEGMGLLELRKFETGVSFKDGELKNTYPINWADTWKLWYQDEEEHQKKTLLRFEQPWVYFIKYCKDRATYENKIFYLFVVNRLIKKALKDNIQKGKTDTLW